jgi:TatA/E family protein of Tat protein translocase
MGPFGMQELILIFVVALIFFGPRKLPELGRSLGKGINEFKRASNELRSTLDDEIRQEERKTATPVPAPQVLTPHETPALPAPGGSDTIEGTPPHAVPETVARGEHGS